MSIAVLFVCTGNICRSPMAERVLLSRVQTGHVTASSAGTYGLTGHPMDAQAALVTRELGAHPDGHSARELTPALIEGADLILAATTEHRDQVLRISPRAMRRTFTMREFTRLGADVEPLQPGVDGAEPAVRIAAIAGRRGLVDPPAPGADDVGDPFGGTVAGMRACGATVSAQVDATIELLGLARRP